MKWGKGTDSPDASNTKHKERSAQTRVSEGGERRTKTKKCTRQKGCERVSEKDHGKEKKERERGSKRGKECKREGGGR